MNEELIAPCGMNCGICSGYLALKHDVKAKGVRMPYCSGCRPRNKQCAFIKKRCTLVSTGKVKYCYECNDFPCEKLEHLDKRYRADFRMSMIDNLKSIQENGMETFIETEKKKWECPVCGGVICCHNGLCFSCGFEDLKQRKQKYRWDEK